MKDHMSPESLMMTHGYEPEWSEGAVKAPLFLTSTFGFKTAEEGKAFFEVAYGLREKEQEEQLGLIYSRINNPNLEILETRLCLWDKADDCAVFESGMSAISTTLLEFLNPGDVLLFSSPTYGGTDHFINHFLKKIGVESIGFYPHQTKEEIIEMIAKSGKAAQLHHIYIEPPANPTNDLIDIKMCKEIADHFSTAEKQVKISVDNTYMGPVWSNPLEHGADIVIYSATKYIGGHSDIIAGAVLGNDEVITRVKTLRTFLGNMASPHTCWLLLRSLETLKVRMEQQARNATDIAEFLQTHELVDKVLFLGNLDENSDSYRIFKEQYSSSGAMISFYVKGGEEEAFKFLNQLKLIKLAVSLGSTESLVQHPASMTHVGVCPELRAKLGITDSLIRLSVGVENSRDLIWDINQALEAVLPSIDLDMKKDQTLVEV
ncbi:MAG: cystathionine gamma-synthase family protein [Flavobacteriales bacterium]|nr:cystathionine gamma-synthase family protein [Flavobacteriales bacterium]